MAASGARCSAAMWDRTRSCRSSAPAAWAWSTARST
jgi:hypothetical protein